MLSWAAFEAEADSTSANTVKLTGCQWGGSADANGVAELVIPPPVRTCNRRNRIWQISRMSAISDAGVFYPEVGRCCAVRLFFTMDAAGIASGGAFLTSELEKRDPLIRKPLTSVTYARDIPIQTGGGWVDYVTAMNVAYGITGGSGSGAVGRRLPTARPSFRPIVAKGRIQGAPVQRGSARELLWTCNAPTSSAADFDQLLQDGIRLTYDKSTWMPTSTGFEGLRHHRPDEQPQCHRDHCCQQWCGLLLYQVEG